MLVPALSSGALAFVPAIYLARLVPLHDLGLPRVLGIRDTRDDRARGLGGVAARGRSIDAVLIGLGLIVAVLVADGVTGSHLQLNSALGFSAEVAGRFIGYGNAGYALLAAAALLFAGLAAHRLGARTPRPAPSRAGSALRCSPSP